MSRRFPIWLKQLRSHPHKRRQSSGFTLIELLVALLVGSIITLLLLGLVVRLTETNARDAAYSQVQQDMQAAIDFMNEDLREAVFVYNGQCLEGTGVPSDADFSGECPGIVNYIPAAMNSGNRRSVLAFWRTEPLPVGIEDLCRTNVAGIADGSADLLLQNVCISGSTYTLVVYAIDTSVDATWSGKARIYRYALPQFADNATTATETPGYARPKEGEFLQWPFTRDDDTGNVVDARRGVPSNPAQVLVDYVDDGVDPPLPATPIEPNCDEFGANSLSSSNALPSFYACVRGGGIGSPVGQNQDVLVTLVGSPAGLPGFPGRTSRLRPLSPLQSRTLVRGILQKR